MEQYFEAKARSSANEYAKRAVIWVDDPYGERLAELTALPVTPRLAPRRGRGRAPRFEARPSSGADTS